MNAFGTGRRLPCLALLLLLFLIEWLLLAISPYDRHDWALENVLVVVLLVPLVLTRRIFPLSALSYTLVFVFLAIHEIGAHYTYAMVPYDDWLFSLTGHRLNELFGWQRNHFDRMVHFSYGLLMAYPMREIFFRVADARGFWGYFLPLDLTMSTSMLFELFEWGAVELFSGELGIAYLGTQGDIWDAHKDMALASLGALIAMLVTLAVNLFLRRDVGRELADSLRVKHPEPLGEQEIHRLWRKRNHS